MKFNVFKAVEKIPSEKVRFKLLDHILEWTIPFNRHLGLKIISLSENEVRITSPQRFRRKNHVGGAHACALALLGEYPAGLLIAQNFPMENYRFIIGRLEVNYHKQGRGLLTAITLSPDAWPEIQEGEAWVQMLTKIENEAHELVAEVQTHWQIKSWKTVRTS